MNATRASAWRLTTTVILLAGSAGLAGAQGVHETGESISDSTKSVGRSLQNGRLR